MDEALGKARWSEIYVILDRLSSTLQKLPPLVRNFCYAVREYPDEALRAELTAMVREARLRKIVRLDYDLREIIPFKYFELIEPWLRDTSEETAHEYVEYWAERAKEHNDACLLASRAIERTSIEWGIIERWLEIVGARQQLEEKDASIPLWSMWRFTQREHISPLTISLKVPLKAILRSMDDLGEIVVRLGSFWDGLSSDIRAISRAAILPNRIAIISSGKGKEMMEQWSVISDLIRAVWLERGRVADLVRTAPPAIRQPGLGFNM